MAKKKKAKVKAKSKVKTKAKPVRKALKKSKAKSKKTVTPKKVKKSTPSKKKSSSVKKKVSKKMTTKKVKTPATNSLSVGQEAPAFSLVSDRGEIISLESLKGKWVVLYFYPKDMTPGCTTQACDFQESNSRLQAMGVTVLGVSKDDLNSHKKFREKYGLGFDLLSDLEGRLCEAYGVWKEKMNYGKKYMGIERSTFIINPDSKIAKVYTKVRAEGHVSQVLEDLKLLIN